MSRYFCYDLIFYRNPILRSSLYETISQHRSIWSADMRVFWVTTNKILSRTPKFIEIGSIVFEKSTPGSSQKVEKTARISPYRKQSIFLDISQNFNLMYLREYLIDFNNFWCFRKLVFFFFKNIEALVASSKVQKPHGYA